MPGDFPRAAGYVRPMRYEDVTAGAGLAEPRTDPVLGGARPRTPAWIRVLRPRQWLKNLLVLGAPLAAGRLTEPDVLLGSLVAVGVFCLAASGCYLFNDVRDVEGDRLHPRKQHRPVASGEVPVAVALAGGCLLTVLGIVLSVWWSLPLGLTVLAYLGVQVAYTSGLKHQPALDLAAVSSGFLLRAVAGGTATGIPSRSGSCSWRRSARCSWSPASGTPRSAASAAAPAPGAPWSSTRSPTCGSLDHGGRHHGHRLPAVGPDRERRPVPGHDWAPLSVAPFVLGLLRYAADVDRGRAGAPEDIVAPTATCRSWA